MLTDYIEEKLLLIAKKLQKEDLRCLIHLIANVCKKDFGSDKFHRNFVSLENLKLLARV